MRHITSERSSICVKLVCSASAAASWIDVKIGPASAVVAKVMTRSDMTWVDAGFVDRATCAAEMPSREAKVLRKYPSSKSAAWIVPRIVTAG